MKRLIIAILLAVAWPVYAQVDFDENTTDIRRGATVVASGASAAPYYAQFQAKYGVALDTACPQ